MKKHPLKEGDTVRLRAHHRIPETAKVETTLSPQTQGGVRLDTRLGGHFYWNEQDLTIIRRAPVKRTK
jgi:hypothetical protein